MLGFSVAFWITISMLWIITLRPSYFSIMNDTPIVFLWYFQNDKKMGVSSLQLPVKFPKLPAFLTGQSKALMWRICPGRVSLRYSVSVVSWILNYL